MRLTCGAASGCSSWTPPSACRPRSRCAAWCPQTVTSFTTHALAPEALLQVYCELERAEPPPCTLLAIRATAFELGGGARCEQALADLALALTWAMGLDPT